MRQRSIRIAAESEEAARARAASDLDAEASQIEVTERADGQFLARLQKADAEVAVQVSEDRSEASIAEYAPPIGAGSPLSEEILCAGLEEAGVVVEPLHDAIQEAVARAAEDEDPSGLVLARSTPPRDGADGRIEFAVETQQHVGSVEADGRVDYRERDTVHSVTAGQVLVYLIPPEPGTPGRDVLGHSLAAQEGDPCSVQAGENVELTEDGSAFRATTAGMVVLDGEALSVTDVYEINGDVDFSTGNIRMDQGSVRIKGAVRAGFSVIASKDIVVGEAVENATVEAGGDIEVRRGIVMRDEGSLKAGGNVSAHFAKNARIAAGGDIEIDNDITHCELTAGGRVIATKGKGRIQGGAIHCGDGVEANVIGSDAGVLTTVTVGLQSENYEELAAEKERLGQTITKIDNTLGTEDARTILSRTPPPKRTAVATLLKNRIAARDRLKEIEDILRQIEESARQAARARVKARRTIHPGTTITIAGCRFRVEHPLNASQAYYDAASGSIQTAPM